MKRDQASARKSERVHEDMDEAWLVAVAADGKEERMNADTAAKILEVAQEGGYFDEAWPDTEEKLIEAGEFYLTHAMGAVEAEVTDEFIERIIKLGGEGQVDDGYEEPESKELDPPEEPPEEIKRERLPIPRQIQGEPPEMPYDIAECSDKQIRSLASRFQACLNRALWQLKAVTDASLRAKQLRSASFRRAYLAEEVAAREVGLKATKEALELAAQASPDYIELDEKVFEVEQEIRTYKALKEVYEGNISRLSREATIRDDEFKRSGRS